MINRIKLDESILLNPVIGLLHTTLTLTMNLKIMGFDDLTSLNFNYAQPYLDIQQFVSTIRERETERVWFGSVWFGLV